MTSSRWILGILGLILLFLVLLRSNFINSIRDRLSNIVKRPTTQVEEVAEVAEVADKQTTQTTPATGPTETIYIAIGASFLAGYLLRKISSKLT